MMKVKVLSICFGIFIVCGTVLIFGFTETNKKGLVTYADGQVKKSRVDQENWENAPVNTEVVSGDKVRTYRESRAELDLASLDIIRLAPRTIIDVVKLYEETKEKKVATSIQVEQGELWASVHEVDMNTEFDISAPVAAAAITGTVLRMKVNDDTTTQIKVYNGEVEVSGKMLQQEESSQTQPQSLAPHEVQGPQEIPGPIEVSLEEWVQIVKALQQITINHRGQILSYGDFSPEDSDEKTKWVNWNKERDKKRSDTIQKSDRPIDKTIQK